MDVQGLPILQGPVDHMRQGFRSFEQATTAQHPIQLMQNRADLEWNMKLDTVRRTHGSHMAMRLATEKAVMSRMRRLPGLKSSNIGLETLLGTDKQIEFQDYLNGELIIFCNFLLPYCFPWCKSLLVFPHKTVAPRNFSL